MINKIPFMDRYQARDEKEYYVYIPGTTHYKNDEHGNPRYVYDRYYLDNEFNKYLGKAIPWVEEQEDAKWVKPTKEELEEYKCVLEAQSEKKVQKLA